MTDREIARYALRSLQDAGAGKAVCTLTFGEKKELNAEIGRMTLLRTTYYVDYRTVGSDKYIFTKLLAVDALEKGRQTYLTNEDISTAKIPDYVFSKAYLEEQSR